MACEVAQLSFQNCSLIFGMGEDRGYMVLAKNNSLKKKKKKYVWLSSHKKRSTRKMGSNLKALSTKLSKYSTDVRKVLGMFWHYKKKQKVMYPSVCLLLGQQLKSSCWWGWSNWAEHSAFDSMLSDFWLLRKLLKQVSKPFFWNMPPSGLYRSFKSHLRQKAITNMHIFCLGQAFHIWVGSLKCWDIIL